MRKIWLPGLDIAFIRRMLPTNVPLSPILKSIDRILKELKVQTLMADEFGNLFTLCSKHYICEFKDIKILVLPVTYQWGSRSPHWWPTKSSWPNCRVAYSNALPLSSDMYSILGLVHRIRGLSLDQYLRRIETILSASKQSASICIFHVENRQLGNFF